MRIIMNKKGIINTKINKIGIIDADLIGNGTRHPNLALMKISAYYKGKGKEVTLLTSYESIPKYEYVFISKVFSYTCLPENFSDYKSITKGGTGFFEDGGENLPEEIEHHFPDYHLYDEYIEKQIANGKSRKYYNDYIDFSIGFATRGCFRKCDFCVNKKYDRAIFHSHLNEWVDPERKGIYLWDDNIFAYEKWREVFDELEKIGKPFQFRQGIDGTNHKVLPVRSPKHHFLLLKWQLTLLRSEDNWRWHKTKPLARHTSLKDRPNFPDYYL